MRKAYDALMKNTKDLEDASRNHLLKLLKQWRDGDQYRMHRDFGHPAMRPEHADELAIALDVYEEAHGPIEV